MSQLTLDLIVEWTGDPETKFRMIDHEDQIQDAIDGVLDALLWATPAFSTVLDDGTIVEDEKNDQSFSDLNFDRDDVADISLVSVSREVIDFIGSNWADCLLYSESRDFDPSQGSVWSYLGHDLALTREHHGAGFWDRGLGELGDRLTEACKPYGEFNMSISCDGVVYID